MKSKTKILIAGASGTNGREILSLLSTHGIPARAMVRNKERNKSLASETVELVEGDLSLPETLNIPLRNIDTAYIIIPIHRDASRWFENFLMAAKVAGIHHIIRLSGLGSDTESKSEILRQHGYSDKLLRESGFDYTIVRPNSFFQNILWQARQIKRKNRFCFPMGDAAQSTIDVKDIGEAVFEILTTNDYKNKTYSLTGPETLSFFDAADHLSQLLEREIKYQPITSATSEQSMLCSGVPSWNAHALSEIQELFSTGNYSETTEDLKTIIKRRPTSFIEFAKANINQF